MNTRTTQTHIRQHEHWLMVIVIGSLLSCASDPGVKKRVNSLPLSAASGAPINPDTEYRQSFGIVIGINDYDDPNIDSLNGAEEDARRMASMLEAQGFQHVERITGRDATRLRIMSRLGTWLADRATINDRIFVYFAGHGFSRNIGEQSDGYLLTRDTKLSNVAATAIPMKVIRDLLLGYTSKHTMFVADACYSGLAFGQARSVRPERESALYHGFLSAKSRAFLMASQADNKAYEWRGHGLFTETFMEGLQGGADHNRDGIVTSHDLISYVSRHVPRKARMRLNTSQTPFTTTFGDGRILFRSRYFKRPPGLPSPATNVTALKATEENPSLPMTTDEYSGLAIPIPKAAVYPNWNEHAEALRTRLVDITKADNAAHSQIRDAWCALAEYDETNVHQKQASSACTRWTALLEARAKAHTKVTDAYADLLKYLRVAKPNDEDTRSAIAAFIDMFPHAKKPVINKARRALVALRAGQPIAPILTDVPQAWVTIDPGQFRMGTPKSEARRDPDEAERAIKIDYQLLVQRHEVTQGEWQATMGTHPSEFKGCGSDCPVERVNLFDALAYANTLSRREKREACYDFEKCTGTAGVDLHCRSVTFMGTACNGYRLPTDPEWEFVARAGTSTEVYAGDIVLINNRSSPQLNDIGWYSGNSTVSYRGSIDCSGWFGGQQGSKWCGTQPVGLKRPNPFGLHDTIGNVWEWVWSEPFGRFSEYKKPSTTRGQHSVSRGCGWFNEARDCRAANRFLLNGANRYFNLGFRLVRTLATRAQ
jgi:formylglycine-generating enzyme required for sulfatase activity